MLATLLDVCGLARLFEDGFPLLHHCYDCWEALLRKRMPHLAAHIDGARDRPRLREIARDCTRLHEIARGA